MWPVHRPDLEFRVTRDPLHDALRTACFAALSPLYQHLRQHGPIGRSHVTPVPEPAPDHLPGYHSVMEREDDDLCWPEILHLVTLGAQALSPHDPGAGPAAVATFSSPPSWWREELLAAHSFLVQSSAVFADRYLDRAQQCYMLGLALWFLEPAG